MGSYSNSWSRERDEMYIDRTPDAENDAKLLLAKYRKIYQNTHAVSLEFRETWPGEMQYVIVCIPTPAHLAKLEAEYEEYRREHPEDFEPYRYQPVITPKKRKPGRGKPETDELEQLEQSLCQPRPRHQGGFGRVYRPTRKRRYARRDSTTWKRHRTEQWQEPAVSYRTLVHTEEY